ncbi:MAG: CatB-related O-acetyltransferase [Magnetospiraceae bacterium]
MRKRKYRNFFTKYTLARQIEAGAVTVGDHTYGTPTVLFDRAAHLTLGKYCSIAEGVVFVLGGNHRVDWISTYPFSSRPEIWPEAAGGPGHPATKGDIVVGNDVWFGRNATIYSGVTIGDGAVIAGDSVVATDVGAYEIFGGNPARCIRKRFNNETIAKLLDAAWWNLDEETIRALIPLLLAGDTKGFLSAVHDRNGSN